MEVILKKNFANLGYKGDIVKVKPGYANNYLIPNEIAIVASLENKKSAVQDDLQATHKASRIKELAEKKAKQIESITVKVSISAANDDGKIFGSVTPLQISQAYLKHSISIDSKSIVIKTPIKTLGVYELPINLHKEVIGNGKIEVVKE